LHETDVRWHDVLPLALNRLHSQAVAGAARRQRDCVLLSGFG